MSASVKWGLLLAGSLGLVLVAALFIGKLSHSGTPQAVTSTVKHIVPSALPAPRLIGWMAYWDEKAAYTQLTKVMNRFAVFSPMLYHVDPQGNLRPYTIVTKTQVMTLASLENIPLMPTIGDDGNVAGIGKLLKNPEIRAAFINKLVNEAKSENFSGWVLDFEVLQPNDAENFSIFVEETAKVLHENNLRLDVIVYARTESEAYPPSLAHDYARLGSAADRLILMTYNYHNELSEPGGQTPPGWLRQVITYALERVSREKLVVGLSTHGYSWKGDTVVGLTFTQVADLILQEQISPVYDADEGAMRAVYGEDDKTEVYFETGDTIQDKIGLVQKEFGINTFALWRPGAEDPRVWDLIP